TTPPELSALLYPSSHAFCSPPPPSPTPLFLHSPRHPPALHSFPTRRSSDLNPSSSSTRSARRPPPRPPISPSMAKRVAPCSEPRSEEHTSELQSHLNLVCRLLLEKKKKEHQKRQLRADKTTISTTDPRTAIV